MPGDVTDSRRAFSASLALPDLGLDKRQPTTTELVVVGCGFLLTPSVFSRVTPLPGTDAIRVTPAICTAQKTEGVGRQTLAAHTFCFLFTAG